ncbi:MAG: FAD-binding oxidoreductase [Thermomicrobiales bacterium]
MTAADSTLPLPAIASLVEALGADNVSTDLSDRLANARGVWPVELKTMRRAITGTGSANLPLPGCVVWPTDTEAVSAVLRVAQQWRIPVVPFGGGSGIVGGTAARSGCISLDTKRLARLRVDPVSLVARAQAGIVGADLERRLNELGYSLGHFPQSLHSGTVGGWVATRASGTFSTLHGNIEDRVVGLEVVLPGGEVLRTRPSPRSATGPNLAELFIGSEGGLGVVTEVALWVHPLATHRIWASYAFPSFVAGLDAVRAFVQGGARPGVVRLYDAGETAHKFPDAGLPSGANLLVLVYEGAPELVAAHEAVAHRSCLAIGGTAIGSDPAHHWWRTRFDTRGLVLANSRDGGIADAIEVAGLWDDLPTIYAAMMRVAEHHGARAYAHVSHVYPSGGGLYVIFSIQDTDDGAAVDSYQRLVGDLLVACHEAGGSISHHHGIGRGKAHLLPLEHGAAGTAVLRAIKRAVDPEALLNPGALGLGAEV